MGESRTRQRLVAHSDLDRFFTYESCEAFQVDEDERVRTLSYYCGTLRVTPITDGDRSFAEWSAMFECSEEDAEYWCKWWAENPPGWLESLRAYLAKGD